LLAPEEDLSKISGSHHWAASAFRPQSRLSIDSQVVTAKTA
jgi:hypothetical protein